MPLSISDSLSHIAHGVVVEIVEYLVLLVDGVEEVVEELDVLALVLKEFDNLAVIVEVWAQDEVREVGGCLEVDMGLEADEICEEFMDLCNLVPAIECVDGEGGGREGGNGSLSPGDDVEGGGHGAVEVVVVAGKACNWCRTGFWVV